MKLIWSGNRKPNKFTGRVPALQNAKPPTFINPLSKEQMEQNKKQAEYLHVE